jgi:predicted TIM-barrel fold metal-dependent hydrolase
LVAFAQPDHVLFGSDWPVAPAPAVHYFAAGLDEHLSHTPFGTTTAAGIDHDNAALCSPPGPPSGLHQVH